jgi:NAD-dependent dihydropyrimidine dehydrogenase PreA subunit
MIESLWFPQIDKAVCTGCGDCVAACPTEVLELVDGQTFLAEPAACNYCGACESICPVQAIALPYQVVLKPPDITGRQLFDGPYSTGKAPTVMEAGRRLR